VLFDFYGTLARAVAWGPTVEEAFARRGFTLEAGAWDRWAEMDLVDGVEHAEHSASPEAYEAWERSLLRARALACGVGADDVDALVDDLHAFTKTFTLEAYPEASAVLGELRRRGVVVAVCSNWDWHLDRALAQSGLDGLVDVAVTSARAGARKPHPSIYHHTLQLCGGLDPADALFVGDTWEADVEGPRAAGLRPVHVLRPDDSRPTPAPAGPAAVARVADLTPVPDLL
jgi:putative hydrolase of the HAD superfamily